MDSVSGRKYLLQACKCILVAIKIRMKICVDKTVVNIVRTWGQTKVVVLVVVLNFFMRLVNSFQLSFYGGQFSPHVHLCKPKSTQIA